MYLRRVLFPSRLSQLSEMSVLQVGGYCSPPPPHQMTLASQNLSVARCSILHNQNHLQAESLLYVNALGFFCLKDPFNIKSIWNLCWKKNREFWWNWKWTDAVGCHTTRRNVDCYDDTNNTAEHMYVVAVLCHRTKVYMILHKLD